MLAVNTFLYVCVYKEFAIYSNSSAECLEKHDELAQIIKFRL